MSALMRTPAVSCPRTATVREAAALMQARGVGSVVIVTDGDVAGIVTDRDIALRVVAAGLTDDATVDGVMSPNVARAWVDDDIGDAARTMCARHVRRLPVVDASGRLHGVLGLDDVVRYLAHQVDDVSDLLLAQVWSAP